ncbi:hypothetical protein ACJIZ3_022614 [Penstemon smallii]|uniref:Transcription factor IIIC 90kDa subunit N-terminal domain-containing protein n=1 Tax=Penstemon smallii TaxID=265156 RepID=A0ABD3TPN1_9LAMI
MSSRFHSAVLGSSLVYPNAVVWSEENLVAVACSNVILILNPDQKSKSRGVITVPSSKPFHVGLIDSGGADLLSGCLLPFELSRDTRPCARSISWSPAGLANNVGCLLAVCTTGGRVKLYRFPFCEFLTEWIEVMDISEMLYTHLKDINFGESDVLAVRDEADHEHANSSKRKVYKRRRKNEVAVKEPDSLREINTLQMIPVSESKGKRMEMMSEDCMQPLITVQQYASRNAMLTSLTVAWSPILGPSGDGFAIPHNSSNCCSVLAVGGKCGSISFWRIHAPECYSIVNTRYSGKVSLVGLLKAHDTWITTINWALCGSDVSTSQFLVATGSSDGRVKIWQVTREDLLKSSEVCHASFTLLKEVRTADYASVSVLSLIVPTQSPGKLLLAIGKGSGSFEVCILDMPAGEFETIGCYNAHDQIVTGLAWTLDGRCLYSCSQDNSMKSWILAGNYLREVPIPSNTPGLKNSFDVPHVSDSCFGLAVSPGNLAIAVARKFDSDLLDPMYEGRTHKGAVDFHWIGGQQLDVSSNMPSDLDFKAFPGFPEKELFWWKNNILWSLNQFENLNRLLNLWDIVAALLSFKKSVTKYVEHILLNWLTSYFGSHFSISTTFLSEASKSMSKLSSRQLHLINIIIRHVILKECKANIMSSKQQESEWLGSIKEEHVKFWTELLLSSENELRERLVGFSFSAILNLLSDSSSDICEVGSWSPDGLAQMEQWVSLNEKIVKDQFKLLAARVGKVEKRKLQDVFKYEENEQCSFCSAGVPFESTEHAICSGRNCAKLKRCAVTMRVCSTKCSWFCMSCQRTATKLAPKILFTMPGYPPNYFIGSSSYRESLTPCCPFCGILLGRSLPEYFLSPSPV